MRNWCTGGSRHAFILAVLMVSAGCGGPPTGLGSSEITLSFIDGPADHVTGTPIPSFRVWIIDGFGRRATGLQSGSMTVDLFDPSGEVRVKDFATLPLDFGQITVMPTLSLPVADGYRVRARFKGTTGDSPTFSVVEAPDVVRMTNLPAGEVGLLVDGANNIGRLQDIVVKTTSADAAVGVMKSGGVTHAVATFAPDRRPELVPVSWTEAADVLPIALRDAVSLPVTVWIIGGEFATEQAEVDLALMQLNQAWRAERAGVTVGNVQFMDATALAQDFELFAIGLGAPFGPLQLGVGRAAGRFNIYVVSQVRNGGEFVQGFAEQSGTAIAVTASGVTALGPRLLGHQLGHNFGLNHTDDLVGFSIDGNMMTTGQGSMALTEGQTFRAHFDRFSSLRSFRTSDTFGVVSCRAVDANTNCPGLALRIWAESNPASVSSSLKAAGELAPWGDHGWLTCGVDTR